MEKLPEKFSVFGDESVSNNIIVYGMAITPFRTISVSEKILSTSKVKNKIPESEKLHCNVLFHKDKRENSAWKHLSLGNCFELCIEIIVSLKKLGVKFAIGQIDRSKAPKTLPGFDNDPPTPLGPKQLTAFAFMGVAGRIADSLGPTNFKFWLDPDTTKIPWFSGKKKQAHRTHRLFVDLKGLPEPPYLKPEPIEKEKPKLLEVADILAYVSARALSKEASKYKEDFRNLYRQMNPDVSSFHFGSPDNK